MQWGPFVSGGGGGSGVPSPSGGSGLGLGLDKPDLLQVRAPRPTQVLLTTRDQYFPLAGGEAAFNESVAAFRALGLSDGTGTRRVRRTSASARLNLTLSVGNNTHGYVNSTRIALYGFFAKHFGRTGGAAAGGWSDVEVEWDPEAHGYRYCEC